MDIVIVGAGFAGLQAAKALRNAPVRVTVVDQRNHHLFQPLLYQVATAGLNAGDIASPIRRILRKQRNTRVVLGQATSLDLANKRVILKHGSLKFDRLIVATGASHSYFAHPEWASLAPGLKSIDDALDIRRRVLMAFEIAECEPDEEKRKQWMTFVVVGAGPTGVELAGTLAEITDTTLSKDFRSIDPSSARVVLVEAGPRVLPVYPEELSAAAKRQLEQLGVEVRTNTAVVDMDEHGVTVKDTAGTDSSRIDARVVLWAAGVKASPLAESLSTPLDRQGRVKVTPELTVPGHDDVYVIGDLASVANGSGTVPGVAPAAMQEGSYVAERIMREFRGEPSAPFVYRDKGSLATIGRAAAVADFGKLRFSGAFAWLMWLFVHLLFLVGFRNRVAVFLEWAWAYLTHERGARLITGPLAPVAARSSLVPDAKLDDTTPSGPPTFAEPPVAAQSSASGTRERVA